MSPQFRNLLLATLENHNDSFLKVNAILEKMEERMKELKNDIEFIIDETGIESGR